MKYEEFHIKIDFPPKNQKAAKRNRLAAFNFN